MKNIPINFEQPIWLLLPILLVAIAISAFLYYRNPRQDFPPKLNVFLFAIRFVVLFLLGLLLLNPYFVEKTKSLEKPVIVVALDLSESMLNTQDSLAFNQTYVDIKDRIQTGLSSEFDVDILGFDHQVYENEKVEFTGKRTDIGQLLQYVDDKYYMLNLSAIVLLSDGHNNQGISPDYATQKLTAEIYPIAFGDTTAVADMAIDKIFYNKVLRQGGKFPIEVIVQAEGLAGSSAQVQIEYNARVISKKTIDISSDSFNKEVKFELDVQGSGLQRYTIRIFGMDSDRNPANNASDIYVQVVESGTKVLVLGRNPHPDLGAIASALRSAEGYDVSVKTLLEYPFSIADYQLIIMHGLPARDERSIRIFKDEQLKNKALWYILSTASDFDYLANQNIPWEIAKPNGIYEYAQARTHENFSTFQLPTNWSTTISRFPPLYVPFSSYTSLSKSNVFLWQTIRGFETDKPLQVFWSKGKRKFALLTGEGLWKWRMYNYQSYGNYDIFNAFVTRTSRYLLTGVHDDRFNIQYQNVYNETDLIKWEAQVYDEVYEMVNEAEVSVEITDEDGNNYPYQFSTVSAAYTLNLNYLKAGEYSFIAHAKTTDTSLLERGKFVVNAWNMEQSEMGANKDLLAHLAQQSGGKVYYPSQVNQLIKELKERPDFKARSSYVQRIINLIDIKWLAFLLILLLGAEWVLRKRNGSY